jgi:cytoskeletal protein RodZ
MPQSSTPAFSGIFVSYRRDDAAGHAGRLFDRLVSHFGKNRIFMDVDAIEPGQDFVTVIENAVGSCEILIAIIGKQWLSSTGRNTGRLDNPNDFVRLEIATALSRDVRVIPVLVQRTSMPKPEDLPEDLVKLTRRNAVELSDLRWQSDVEQLISVMERVLAQREEARRLAEAARQTEEEATHRAAAKPPPEKEEIERKETEESARRGGEEALRRRRKRLRLLIIASVGVLAIAAVIWIWLTSTGEQQSANQNASTQQTGQTTSTPTPTSSATIPPKSNDNRSETANANANSNSGRPIVIPSPIRIVTPKPNKNGNDNSNTRLREANDALDRIRRQENANRALNRAMSNGNRPE